MPRSSLITIVCALSLSACVKMPSGPSVMVLPGAGRSFDQFTADDLACRGLAEGRMNNAAAAGAQRAEGTWWERQRRYDIAYMQCMYAQGHQIPVPAGPEPGYGSEQRPLESPRDLSPPPAGSPPLPPPDVR